MFFENRRTLQAEIIQDSVWQVGDLNIQALSFRGESHHSKRPDAVEFDAYVCSPVNYSEPLPAFVLLGGLITGREAIQTISQDQDLARRGVFFTLNYPYSGPARFQGLQILPYIPNIRQALFDGVEAVRMAADYLWRTASVDTNRIILIGVSLGAFYAVDAGALDRRFAAVMAFMGGGNLRTLLDCNLRFGGHLKSRILSTPAAALAALLIRPVEPLRLVEQISPRPYIQVSAQNDAQIPHANSMALFEAAREPKNLIWIEAPHLKPGMDDLIKQIIQIADRELQRCGILP
ncbi:MAG: hypothetical protein ABH878_06240 [bacterium]